MRIEVDAVPKPIVSEGFAGQQGGVRTVLIDATACQLTEHGTAEPAEGSVLLLAPVARLEGLLRGQQADAFGVLMPPESDDGTVAVLRIRGSPSHVSPASAVQRAAGALRDGLRTAAGSLSGDAKGLLPGLVIGDTSGLRQSVVRRLQQRRHGLSAGGRRIPLHDRVWRRALVVATARRASARRGADRDWCCSDSSKWPGRSRACCARS